MESESLIICRQVIYCQFVDISILYVYYTYVYVYVLHFAIRFSQSSGKRVKIHVHTLFPFIGSSKVKNIFYQCLVIFLHSPVLPIYNAIINSFLCVLFSELDCLSFYF